MKRIIKIFIIAVLFSCSQRGFAQIPNYYFDIVDVYQTPFSLKKTEEGYVSYRLLKVRVEETNYLVVEHFKVIFKPKRSRELICSYYLDEDDFDLYSFKKVNIVEWKALNNFNISLNEGLCYSVQLSDSEENVDVKRCE
ncbi:hypothetical protein [Ekhidna sp.]|uniref:hypothetical protein n=1 Tax=Ekhidna sp. TaxID=2608089 RepID=UPI003297737B